MTYIKIGLQIIGLYLLNWVGNLIQLWLHLPLSGSIIGLLILFVLLITKAVPETFIQAGALTLLKVLPFLFIPSVLGIMNEGTFFKEKGLLFIGAILISTFLTMGGSSWITGKIHSVSTRTERSNQD